MIKIKIDKNRANEPIFKLGFKELDEKENRFLKRALIEGKEITPKNYNVDIKNIDFYYDKKVNTKSAKIIDNVSVQIPEKTMDDVLISHSKHFSITGFKPES